MTNGVNTDHAIVSASYIGKPVDNTAMFITKKVEHLLSNLENAENCLVFCEDTISVPDGLNAKHRFVKTPNPQLEYARFVQKLEAQIQLKNRDRKYTFTKDQCCIGENVVIGENTVIEPFCFIGHDVRIGNNARILSGARIRNAVIGDNVVVNENATIGTQGFTMATDEAGNKMRIPTLGKVVIGDNVEIGIMANICCGSAGNTVIEDFVKIDAFVHVAHDVVLKSNVEIPAGAVIGGFVSVEPNVFIGINSTIRNRVTIGENSVVGMGSVVTKSVPANTTVVGNPAKPLEKKPV